MIYTVDKYPHDPILSHPSSAFGLRAEDPWHCTTQQGHCRSFEQLQHILMLQMISNSCCIFLQNSTKIKIATRSLKSHHPYRSLQAFCTGKSWLDKIGNHQLDESKPLQNLVSNLGTQELAVNSVNRIAVASSPTDPSVPRPLAHAKLLNLEEQSSLDVCTAESPLHCCFWDQLVVVVLVTTGPVLLCIARTIIKAVSKSDGIRHSVPQNHPKGNHGYVAYIYGITVGWHLPIHRWVLRWAIIALRHLWQDLSIVGQSNSQPTKPANIGRIGQSQAFTLLTFSVSPWGQKNRRKCSLQNCFFEGGTGPQGENSNEPWAGEI